MVESAAPADLPELTRLFEAYRLFYEQAPNYTAAQAYVRREVTTASTRFFLARNSAGDALGFVHLIPATNTLVMCPIWYLEDLFVGERFRRQGIAEALMKHAERFAIATGAERLTLATAHDNAAAQALYRKLGYVREDHFWYFHRLLFAET